MKAGSTQKPRVGPDAAVRGVGGLASDLLHALRNPVAAFKTSVELLLSGTVDREDREALERVIRNELVKLNDLLGRCTELTQLSGLALAPANLVDIVRERVAGCRNDVEHGSVSINDSFPDGPVPIDADPAQLGHAIDALLGNAIEASPAGSAIRVAIERRDAEAVITVEDHGRGIAPTALPNVFRLFYTTRKGASGMGLPIARQVITAHGGSIDIRSEVGRGTTVTVTLPVATA